MSGLFATLNSSVKAITAHSRAIEITGKNLANVNNTSYARQRVIYGDRGTVVTPTGAESLGLEAIGVEQLRDAMLDRQVTREISLTSSYQAEQSAYQRAQAGLGQSIDRSNAASTSGTADDKGLAAALDDFFASFQSFAASPTDVGERQTLLQKSQILSDRFRLADQRIAQTQSDLNAEVTSDVADVNRILGSIADLNAQIGRFEVNAPGSAVDLRDQRQAQLEQLAAKMSFEAVDSDASQIQVVTKDTSGGDVVLVDHASVTGAIAFDGNQLTGGASGAVLALGGGSITGALTARDGAVQALRDDLDALAGQLVTAVNAAYNPGGATGDFFVAGGTNAATLALNPALTAATLKASNGGAAGDNTVALAVAQLASTPFSVAAGDRIDGTFSGALSKTVSKLGQALASANSRVDDQNNIEQLVRSQRDSVSGVSLDEEMADLMKYQRAYQASARIFSTVDELLDLVVNRLGQ